DYYCYSTDLTDNRGLF
nr:immunoglobulin light chain junction region [Macaca mulatta]MOW30986.1 immunoglobulin light chain junction region [Macaca mulatta]MOW31122.1 immunoglobulin light chain junction region [Macaca mulatta]MOW31187.1 immunoglobulin light chain junction region [Macaca mulatta]MOW31293.1 immunoglobulin light chain junction region [Macaca mulatta]